MNLKIILIISLPILLSCHNPAEPDEILKDIDGNVYQTVQIGNQVWMAENLRVSRYRNGDPIPRVMTDADWSSLNSGAWSYYLNSESNGSIYGKLYNWYAVADERGLCPEGWHVPGESGWELLIQALGGEEIAGGKMKSTSLWLDPNVGATNISGWSGLPGGNRREHGAFIEIRFAGFFLSSDEVSATRAPFWYLVSFDQDIRTLERSKRRGYSVRCVRN